jgi:hypothetical protein
MKMRHRSAHSRAPGSWPARNIGNQRGRIFALPGVKKHRLFEDGARGNSALAWKGKNTPRRSRSGQVSCRGRHCSILYLRCDRLPCHAGYTDSS